ncbi:MAG: DUF2520 domain-containing protein [Cytophagales bacterium]|nr:DUF2520 domain-containing protein [Cytophagales bacterium]
MAEYYNIAMIGSGNLAWHLAPELENVGHRIVQVFSRNTKNARSLQQRLYHAEINKSLDFSESEIDLVIICISDDAIEQVAREIALPDHVTVVHTSGSQSINRLGYAGTDHIGVFYPLQTFTKSKKITFQDIPILIETESDHTAGILKKLGKSISKKVLSVGSSDRLAIHVAAVFACNFTNRLFEISETILKNRAFDFELLRPLIAETINKGLDIGPANARTGPAARGDLETLDRHMDFLRGTGYREIYKVITDLILNE